MPPTAHAPSLWDIPRLGWVSACAYSPNRGVAAATWLIEAAHLLFQHLRGGVRAIDRHAVVVLTPRSGPGRRRHTVAAALITLVAMTTVIAAVSTVAMYAAEAVGISGIWLDLSGLLLPAGLVIAYAVRGGTTQVVDSERAIAAVAANYPANTVVWHAGGLAAWPRGQGHGDRLLTTLLADGLPGPVLVTARTDRVRAYYLRLGLNPHPKDDTVLVWQP